MPLPAAGYRRSSLIGTVTTAPMPMEMPVLQSFWFLLAAAALLVEGMPPMSRAIMAETVGAVAAAALLVHVVAGASIGLMSRAARPLAPIRWRTGIRLGITDDAGAQWTLHFLPWFGTDLHLGDPAFAEGRERSAGNFRASIVTNIRTGSRHISRRAMSAMTAATCVVLVALLIGTTRA
ncbi:hypothetical protein GFY24_25805 [Nocardia sp. SYP-A9097]|uniref:hypothetical protein n=1 Tax=Nocardia sp. SYP-A9097 TaxID=2663237 RepID=UPI00129C012D|nr:hypothetical protein [Nocardia sp. SYP-A9097]MRH90812.1 hypothetical protein [Nocardia sp. SYP-A9097]